MIILHLFLFLFLLFRSAPLCSDILVLLPPIDTLPFGSAIPETYTEMYAVSAYCSRRLKPTPLAGIVGYSQPAHFQFRVYNLVLCEGYVLTQRLDPIDMICVCPTSRLLRCALCNTIMARKGERKTASSLGLDLRTLISVPQTSQ
jgi:hypothetical protein